MIMETGKLILRIRIFLPVLKVKVDLQIYDFKSKLSSDSRAQFRPELISRDMPRGTKLGHKLGLGPKTGRKCASCEEARHKSGHNLCLGHKTGHNFGLGHKTGHNLCLRGTTCVSWVTSSERMLPNVIHQQRNQLVADRMYLLPTFA
jgi:hypothetical protein